MTKLTKLVRSVTIAVMHPAALFSAGNTALAFGQAEPLGIILNIGLTTTIFTFRFIEVISSRGLGIPFSILASVNFFTALSVEFNKSMGVDGGSLFAHGLQTFDSQSISSALGLFDINNLLNLNQVVLAGHVSALAYVVWGIGHLFAGQHEKKNTTAKKIHENPQTYYAAGDMTAVNASGALNPFSFPFMVLGFIKSLSVGHKEVKSKGVFIRHLLNDVTAARLNGFGFVVGAVTSLAVLNFAIAQALWALAYFSFKRDT